MSWHHGWRKGRQTVRRFVLLGALAALSCSPPAAVPEPLGHRPRSAVRAGPALGTGRPAATSSRATASPPAEPAPHFLLEENSDFHAVFDLERKRKCVHLGFTPYAARSNDMDGRVSAGYGEVGADGGFDVVVVGGLYAIEGSRLIVRAMSERGSLFGNDCISTHPVTGPPHPTIAGAPLFASKEECISAREIAALIPFDLEPPPPGRLSWLSRPSCWQFIAEELAKGPLPPHAPAPYTPREQGLLYLIAQGLTVYMPPKCQAWRVKPADRTSGNIVREEWKPGRVVTYSLSYSFGKNSALSDVHLDYTSEAVTERRADGQPSWSATPLGGRTSVDFTVEQPLAGLRGWFTTIAACRKHVKEHAAAY